MAIGRTGRLHLNSVICGTGSYMTGRARGVRLNKIREISSCFELVQQSCLAQCSPSSLYCLSISRAQRLRLKISKSKTWTHFLMHFQTKITDQARWEFLRIIPLHPAMAKRPFDRPADPSGIFTLIDPVGPCLHHRRTHGPVTISVPSAFFEFPAIQLCQSGPPAKKTVRSINLTTALNEKNTFSRGFPGHTSTELASTSQTHRERALRSE